MNKGDSITLTLEDQNECRSLAKARFANNRKAKIRNQKVGPQSNEVTDLEGLGGEFAFCRLIGTEPDRTIHVRSAKSDKGDASSDEISYDVKTTKYPNGKLLAVPWKDHTTVDVFVLMTGSFPTYTFAGAMKRDDLLQARRLGNLGYGETFIAQQSELKELIALRIRR